LKPRRFTATKLALVALTASALAFPAGRAEATGSVSAVDANGVDYDAACAQPVWPPSPPSPNSVRSPGLPGGSLGWPAGGDGCSGFSSYDGSTEATDLSRVSLSSTAGGQMIARCDLDGAIPPAGSTVLSALDTPAGYFTGAGCKVLFQNMSTNTYIPTNPDGGCTSVFGLPEYDVHGSYYDGFRYFLGFEVNWDGTRWVHSVQVGEYDPSPTGGFVSTELGRNGGAGWSSSTTAMTFGTNWQAAVTAGAPSSVTITVDGIVKMADAGCLGGVFKTVFARPDDRLGNMIGLTHVQHTVTMPVVVPASVLCTPAAGIVCYPDSQFVAGGGELYLSDTTDGNSYDPLFNHNIHGIAYTPGLLRPWAGEAADVYAPFQHLQGVSTKFGVLNMPDTLGPGPACPWPTYGGTFPQNPAFAPNTACQIDDNSFARGSFLPEFWDTQYYFTF
jgi:hypothetical protein